MTFQRRLFLGFALLALPVLLVGAIALRNNAVERRALEALGESLARNRTYAEVETAIANQGEVLWRALSGFEPDARKEFRLQGEVVDYWFGRWEAELADDERGLGDGVRAIHRQLEATGDSLFALLDAGARAPAYELARQELKLRLLPALTEVNHEIYRRARETSVQRAFRSLEGLVESERRAFFAVLVLGALLGPGAAWLIARSLVRPVTELRGAMAIVGEGRLDHPIDTRAADEIGDLARAFARMTERLRAAQAEVVQKEKLASVGEMAAAVAHGLRNPLASLRASAQLALRHPESPAAKAQLRAMIDEVDRLDRRITHLLDYSRPAPAHRIREAAAPLVAGVLAPLRPLLEERRVVLRADVPPDLPMVVVDPVRFEQTITEVVANALDAMPDGGTLTVAARAEAGAVVVEVGDTGPGIPAETLPHVLDPFFTTRPEGTGLGLAIARRFTEQNGGTLALESAPGRGTTVRFRFPAAGAAEPAVTA